MTELTCFKKYDIRGEIDVSINNEIVYRIARAVAQHFQARSIVIGYDARETSPVFADASAKGVLDYGSNVISIGLAGTEEMYWAVTEFDACAGIEITASHNPINYNGMKIVKSGSQPLDDDLDFKVIKKLAENGLWKKSNNHGKILNYAGKARQAYVDKMISFINVSSLKPFKIVVNSGNGAAGPTFDAIANQLSKQNAPIEFIRVHHTPDHTFPNGIPNPLLPQNHHATKKVVQEVGAAFGVAFDGDFDRCFFFDDKGEFVPGEYIVGLLASRFLERKSGRKIVHDNRIIWNTQDIVTKKGGIPIQSRTGHAFIKKAMRENKAVYGGEMSAHHYFQEFAYCDSGMIPWLLITELVSLSGKSLRVWIKDRVAAFPSSGETNFRVADPEAIINRVVEAYIGKSISLDRTDGVSLTFENWRFNLRSSNTEPLVRLNIESRGKAEKIQEKFKDISSLIVEAEQ